MPKKPASYERIGPFTLIAQSRKKTEVGRVSAPSDGPSGLSSLKGEPEGKLDPLRQRALGDGKAGKKGARDSGRFAGLLGQRFVSGSREKSTPTKNEQGASAKNNIRYLLQK